MKTSTSDLSFFFKRVKDNLSGLVETYVDDTIFSGNSEFAQETNITDKRFTTKPKIWDNFRFAGIYIGTLRTGFKIQQRKYIERLKTLEKQCTYDQFRSSRAKISWITLTRPEISVNTSFFAQVTESIFSEKHIVLFNRTVKYLQASKERGLNYKKLDKESLYLKIYSDSSFANAKDMKSQLGYIILLCDKHGKCNVIHYKSYKSRRMARSVLGAETYAFADAFDQAYMLKHDLERIMKQNVSLQMITD